MVTKMPFYKVISGRDKECFDCANWVNDYIIHSGDLKYEYYERWVWCLKCAEERQAFVTDKIAPEDEPEKFAKIANKNGA